MRRAAIWMLMQSGHHHDGEYDKTHEHRDNKMTRETAEKWVSHMRTADGKPVTPPWTIEQAAQVIKQRGWVCDPAEFWADIAKSWLDDADAEPDKAWRYYKYVEKH